MLKISNKDLVLNKKDFDTYSFIWGSMQFL